ncbi:MAG: DUF1731 domain-containing protein [Dehalococcoidia bacterium]|nr:DUF1731 domain-containing protein [Dehalococcoidia bacterium]
MEMPPGSSLRGVLDKAIRNFAPRWAFRLMLGELSSIVLASQKVRRGDP